MVRPRREPHLGWTLERVSQGICDPITLDTAWYRQFSGAQRLPGAGKKFSFRILPRLDPDGWLVRTKIRHRPIENRGAWPTRSVTDEL